MTSRVYLNTNNAAALMAQTNPSFFMTPPIDRPTLERIMHPIIPRDLTLYWTALTHSSIRSLLQHYPENAVHPFYKKGHKLYGKDYEKLEFLGDSVIHASLSSILIRMYPTENEEFLSRVRINIERKSGLADLCRQLGLATFVKKNPDLALSDAIVENVYEGFVGALFEDQQRFLYNGLQRSSEFILKTLHSRFQNIHDIRIDDNFKDTVLRLLDRHVFVSIDIAYRSENKAPSTLSTEQQQYRRNEKTHISTLICKYVPARVEYISLHGYSQQDLAAVMTSIPELSILTKTIVKTGRNKIEAEQSACKELMAIMNITMKRL